MGTPRNKHKVSKTAGDALAVHEPEAVYAVKPRATASRQIVVSILISGDGRADIRTRDGVRSPFSQATLDGVKQLVEDRLRDAVPRGAVDLSRFIGKLPWRHGDPVKWQRALRDEW